jgi:tetratricopeptide (TPR) repeat protein
MKRVITLFSFCILFISCFFSVNLAKCFALDLKKIRVYFLNQDYKQAITEGEKLLGQPGHAEKGIEELYYLLGLSYLKEENYLRASDIFEIILKEYKNSPLKEQAELGLADTFFLRNDFPRAQSGYQQFVIAYSGSRFLPLVYSRLSQCASKLGNIQEAKGYQAKLTSGSRLDPEVNYDLAYYSLNADYYSVQVGSFSQEANAKNLIQKLTSLGYQAYIEETGASIKEKGFRVRVGKFASRKEAVDTEAKLIQQGYPTRICP